MSYIKNSDFWIGALTALIGVTLVVIAWHFIQPASAHYQECWEDCEVTVTPTVTPTPTESTPEATVVDQGNPDKCPNNDGLFQGVQLVQPEGTGINDKGNCYNLTEPTPVVTKAPSMPKALPNTGL